MGGVAAAGMAGLGGTGGGGVGPAGTSGAGGLSGAAGWGNAGATAGTSGMPPPAPGPECLPGAPMLPVTAFDKVLLQHCAGAMPACDVTRRVRFPACPSYRKVTLRLELGPPPQGKGDRWDRLGLIYLTSLDGTEYKIASFITTYESFPFTWETDITDLQLLFQGERELRIWLPSWADDGYQLSVGFEFDPGTPRLMPVQIDNLWNNRVPGAPADALWGQPGNELNETFFTPKRIRIRNDATTVRTRMIITGHGGRPAADPHAAEFYPQLQELRIGSQAWLHHLWRDDCDQNPTGPQCNAQGMCGNWRYSRAGWCPGDLIEPWVVDISQHAVPGAEVELRYAHFGTRRSPSEYRCIYQDRSREPGMEPRLEVSSQLIQFVPTGQPPSSTASSPVQSQPMGGWPTCRRL